MSDCNCSGCPHAANCRCVCAECKAEVPTFLIEWPADQTIVLPPGSWPRVEPPGFRVAEGGVAEQSDEPQIVHG